MACGAPRLTVLGAIQAGGESRRFGSDKARAQHEGRALLDHVAGALRPQVDTLVVVGRDWSGLTRVHDAPEAGLGPLGGLYGALLHADAEGHEAVLSAGCDTLGLPDDLMARLSPGPACAADLPVVGLWPTSLAVQLRDHLLAGKRAVYGWAERCGARQVRLPMLRNVNRPADLRR